MLGVTRASSLGTTVPQEFSPWVSGKRPRYSSILAYKYVLSRGKNVACAQARPGTVYDTGNPQGSVKVAGVTYFWGHECITCEETPHPPPCGPPSPQGRGIETKTAALSQGRGGTARRWVRGPFQPYWTLTDSWGNPTNICVPWLLGVRLSVAPLADGGDSGSQGCIDVFAELRQQDDCQFKKEFFEKNRDHDFGGGELKIPGP